MAGIRAIALWILLLLPGVSVLALYAWTRDALCARLSPTTFRFLRATWFGGAACLLSGPPVTVAGVLAGLADPAIAPRAWSGLRAVAWLVAGGFGLVVLGAAGAGAEATWRRLAG